MIDIEVGHKRDFRGNNNILFLKMLSCMWIFDVLLLCISHSHLKVFKGKLQTERIYLQ